MTLSNLRCRRKRAEARRKAGICAYCDKKIIKDQSVCQEHLLKRRENSQRYLERQRREKIFKNIIIVDKQGRQEVYTPKLYKKWVNDDRRYAYIKTPKKDVLLEIG